MAYGIEVLTQWHKPATFEPDYFDKYVGCGSEPSRALTNLSRWTLFAKSENKKKVLYAQCAPHDILHYPVTLAKEFKNERRGTAAKWSNLLENNKIVLEVWPVWEKSAAKKIKRAIKPLEYLRAKDIPDWMRSDKRDDYWVLASPGNRKSKSFREVFGLN